MRLNVARHVAELLMDKHGLTAQGWRFGWDNARCRFGICRHGQKLITMSKSLVMLNDAERVSRTILHEIAHALTRGKGHTLPWKMKCLEIGLSNPERCYNTANTEIVKPPFVATCPGCRTEHRVFRHGKRRKSCGRCAKGFDPRFELVFKRERHTF